MLFRIILLVSTLSLSNAFCQQSIEPTEDSAQVIFKVTDPKGIPEQGAKIVVKGLGFNYIKSGIADVDGKFVTLLPEGKKFVVEVEKFGKRFVFDKADDIIDIPSMDGEISFEQNLAIAVITKYIRTFKIENLYFDSNKWDIKKEAFPSLDMVHEQLKKNPNMRIEIAGHTDSVGDDESNMRLSQNRANSVKDYLVKKGITSERIISKGYGESNPVESNETDAGRAMNRRTEVRVITE